VPATTLQRLAPALFSATLHKADPVFTWWVERHLRRQSARGYGDGKGSGEDLVPVTWPQGSLNTLLTQLGEWGSYRCARFWNNNYNQKQSAVVALTINKATQIVVTATTSYTATARNTGTRRAWRSGP